MGWNSKPEGMTVNTPEKPNAVQDEVAVEKTRAALAALLRDQGAVQRAMRETTEIAAKVFGDKSVMAAKNEAAATREVVTEFDRTPEIDAACRGRTGSGGQGRGRVRR